jgi:hypothetical protein
MFRTFICLSLFLFIVNNVFTQVIELPHQYITAETINLEYPVNAFDVRAIGMGNTQIANGRTFNAMLYNPALLGHERNSIEYFGIQAGMPPTTYDAVNYLSKHISEFEEAVSLNQVWDGLDQLTMPGATPDQRLRALHDIQDGLVFVDDLFYEVTGPGDDPKVHGTSLVAGVCGQIGNFGFSLYGFGQAGFILQQSPTFEALLEVEVPENLDNPVATARAIIQLKTALAPAIIGPRKFSDKVYPTAFYSSYFDIVATAGYAMPVYKNITIGGNLKIINRRFLLDKIAVKDYDEIISSVWEKFQSDITGITCDLGAYYQFKSGTSIGATFQNIIPVQKIKKSVDTEFKFHRIEKFDINANGQIDSLKYVTWEATVTWPFDLKVPFIISFGADHPITENWDISIDWVDIAENDTRYEKTEDRIRLGTEYRYNALEQALLIIPRLGLSDQRLTLGLGFDIIQHIYIDGAYAYDRFVNKNAYYAQFKVIF